MVWDMDRAADNLSVDVVVVGGGTAGCFSAIAAAKQGASVLLIEKAAQLGGTMTTAGVAFPGLFHAWGKQIIDGPCWESIRRAAVLNGAKIPEICYQPQHHWQEQVPVNPLVYSAVLDQMCLESGVHVMLHAMPFDAKETEQGIELLLACKEGPLVVEAKQAIDATGDANLTQQLGYPLQVSEEVQPATLINNIAGYDCSLLDRDEFLAFLQEMVKEGALHPRDYQGYYLWDQLQNHRLSMHLHAPQAQTSAGKTALEQKARRELLRIVQVLRRFPGLENLYVTSFAAECGVRETVRIDGELCMRAEDYVAAYRYEDAVCYAFYPVDRHMDTGIHQIFLEPERVPTIPYRALRPKGAKRLLAAGRCISADRDTQSAIRVCAPCMAMGQAAGVAAAAAVQLHCGVDAVPYAILCEKLGEIGAIVP